MSGEPLEEFLIGIDVGTTSVRGALINKNGVIKKVATHSIKIWNPRPEYFEQSSDDIWEACIIVIKKVIEGIDPKCVKGLGFDATCSLVALDKENMPLSISLTGENKQNIIMWMDHRAGKQAEFINKLQHPSLKNVGGKISLEMQVPKLLWIKENLPESCWTAADKFFDLPDFLTWKATGCDSRSLCSVVCKWMFEASPSRKCWNTDFFKSIGLEDLSFENYKKIGKDVKAPGDPCGDGLTLEAARELGLIKGTPVATSIIDAHAGGLGLIGCYAEENPEELTRRLCLICGTSSCHMIVNENPIFVRGVWGPYYSAMVPSLWLNEAGQSASGKLLDHIIETNPAFKQIKSKISSDKHVVQYLNEILIKKASECGIPEDFLTKDVHIWPDFHGNRSPISDSSLKGMISGLDLSTDEEQLALLYLATVQALAYGTRHIMEVLIDSGYKDVDCILMCGGLSKNELFVQSQANIVSKPVLIPHQVEPVLLGSAMLAAKAAGIYPDVVTSVLKMTGSAREIKPNSNVQRYHNKKYKVFKKMLEDQLLYREIMNEED